MNTRLLSVLSVLLVVGASVLTLAAVPQLINYQGRLTTLAGQPVADGNYLIKFVIYDAPSGGAVLWDNNFRTVPVAGGLLTYALGDSTALPANLFAADTTRWLGITVGADPELTPRMRFTSVSFSYKALRADTSGHALGIADNTITSAKIQDGSIALGDVGQNGATLNQVMKWNGVAWTPSNDEIGTAGGWIDNGTKVSLQDVSDSVGIGMTSPGAKLEVAGQVKIVDGTQGTGKVLTSDANGLASWQSAAGSAASGWTDDGTVVRLTDGTDKVGIGTTTPNEQLEITGNLRLPLSTASVGVVKSGGAPFIHNFGTNNTFIGIMAGNFTLTGTANTASGNYALGSVGSGVNNTADGYMALLSNTAGNNNTASGYRTLYSNSTGSSNTASGTQALQSNTTGGDNTASGSDALQFNTSGSQNTATGREALRSNTSGHHNTASGTSALYSNNTGQYNTASGSSALQNNSIGTSNTAGGVNALINNTTGNYNTASGYRALNSNTIGSSNTAVGSNANVSASDLTNATVIGANAIVDASNKIRLGDVNVTVIEGQVAYTFPSDRNMKENFQPVDGNEVLRKIHNMSLTSWNYKGNDPSHFRHYGPVAQEFFAAFGQDAVGQCGDSVSMNSGDEAGILMIAVQALERRTAEMEAIKAENKNLRSELDDLKKIVTQLMAQYKQDGSSQYGLK